VEIRGGEKPAWPKNTLENTSLNEPEPIDRTRYESTAGAFHDTCLRLDLAIDSYAPYGARIPPGFDHDSYSSWRYLSPLKFTVHQAEDSPVENVVHPN